MKLITWLRKLFPLSIKSEPQGKINRQWLEMRRAILENEREGAVKEAAFYRLKIEQAHKSDARRGAWQEALERTVKMQLEAERALREIEINQYRELGAL